jgi:hypothetical protein
VQVEPVLFVLIQRNKNQGFQIKSLKTTSKLRSAPRAVRLSGSTRGVLPLRFFVVFYAFYLMPLQKEVFICIFAPLRFAKILLTYFDLGQNLNFISIFDKR